uniref:DUF1254 domain-containing protein n=1 Tax=Steinernema glaseri TaxID=37863 RepID=A0A1I8ADE5_9BILA
MAVASAAPFVRQHAHGVTLARGGEGAAREFCELILQAQGNLDAANANYLVIAALFAAVGYWNISPETFLDEPAAQVDESAIDYYAINAHSVQFLPDGKLQYEMTADKVEHLKASEVTLLTTPDLNMYRGTAYPWHVQSTRGEVNPD